MDVRLSPEQKALRDSAAQVVTRLAPGTVRDLDDDERRAKLDAAVEASGWRELRAAGDDGRPLATAVEAALVAEELAAGLADVAYIGPVLAGDLTRLAASPEGSGATEGSGAAAGERPAGTVLLTPDLRDLADLDPGRPEKQRRDAVAIDASGAAHALALRLAPGWVGGEAGVVAFPLEPVVTGVDLTRPSARPSPTGTPTPIGSVTVSALDRWRALALALSCADLVGAMRGAVALGCDYASNRRQYGVPVGSFQAVQHLLADAHVATEGSSSVALHAAWAVDALDPAEAVAAGAVAKAYCARAGRSVAETVIQVHGGIGNTWECRAHLYLRRVLLSSAVLGGVGPSLQRVLAGRWLGAVPGDGGGGDGLL